MSITGSRESFVEPMPFAMRLTRWGMGILDAILPDLAANWAYQLFFTPRPTPFSGSEWMWLNKLERQDVLTLDSKIVVYIGGSAPYVVFAHGWSGKSTQFSEMADSVMSAGYGIILLDMPGHGQSPGDRTDALQFANALESVINGFSAHCVVTHSLSGLSMAWSLSENALWVPKWVTISTPAIPGEMVDRFITTIGAGLRTKERLVSRLQKRYNIAFSEFALTDLLRKASRLPDILPIHDLNDRQVSIKNAKIIAADMGLEYIETHDLGHNRILKSPELTQRILKFIEKPLL